MAKGKRHRKPRRCGGGKDIPMRFWYHLWNQLWNHWGMIQDTLSH